MVKKSEYVKMQESLSDNPVYNPELDVYVLPNVGGDGVLLVKNNMPDSTVFEDLFFPDLDTENLPRIKSQPGREFMYSFPKDCLTCASFSDDPLYTNARYVVIPIPVLNEMDFSDKSDIYLKLEKAGAVKRLSPEQCLEGEDIYRTLVPYNEYGAVGSDLMSRFRKIGIQPKHFETDVVQKSVQINAAGDRYVGIDREGRDVSIRDFLFQFHSFDKMDLDLRGTFVSSGTYKGQFNTDIEQVLSNINNWIPDALKYKVLNDCYINVTGSRVKQDDGLTVFEDDGLTVFENGKAREPKPEEKWPVYEAGTDYLSPL
ncbi:MAG: hypothetical protein U9O53_05855 [archaeon]|nr:hypothetical protein [archaeon]